jgi:DNA helicase-2/ATP-dependent DNA helicase PcrA
MELTSRYHEFEKRGGLKLTESAHIKDVLSFFRVLVNPWDHLSWNRILLQLDKVGPKTAQKILSTIREETDPIYAITRYKPAAGGKAGFKKMCELFSELRRENLTPAGQFDLVMEYYEPIFEKIYYDDYPKRRKELEQIKALTGEYGDLQSLVDDTALDPPENSSVDRSETTQLVLSTIHSAKGLEWDVVFVIGLAEGRFPHQNAIPGEQFEEERRLLYVAATRARKQLFLTYPRELATPDRKLRRTVMSPFLQEINPGLYNKEEDRAQPGSGTYFSTEDFPRSDRPKKKKNRKKLSEADFTPGMIVQHPFFGQGVIREIPGPRRVEVRFDRHGDKILHLDYAKLEPVG